MIAENGIFWQGVVFVVWGYVVAVFANALIGYPRRLLESA